MTANTGTTANPMDVMSRPLFEGPSAQPVVASAHRFAAALRRHRRPKGGSFGVRATVRSTKVPGVLVVSPADDAIARTVVWLLLDAGLPVLHAVPTQLGRMECTIRKGSVFVADRPLRGLLLRAGHRRQGSTLSDSFSSNPATMATWLAAANTAAVKAVNAYDAEAWVTGADWTLWHRRLSEGDVPLYSAADAMGTGGADISLVACGDVVSGPRSAPVMAAAEVLGASGIHLASVTTLPGGGVAAVDTQPKITQPGDVRKAAARITNYLAA